MPITDNAQQRAAFTYNAAADFYDASPLGFWDYFGRATVRRLSLAPGSRVLDVCCGSGASALAAAETVSADGQVVGVDLAERLLELARAKAAQRQLMNVRFEVGDLLSLNYPSESFDAVICVFGIFFVPNMTDAVRKLWRLLKRGGKLAITTWGPNLFEPLNSAFWNAIRNVRPELHKSFNPWDRIHEAESLRTLLKEGGVESAEIMAENRFHPINSPDDWWTIALGSGYRGTIEQLTAAECDEVKRANIAFLREAKTSAVETNALYATATKFEIRNKANNNR